MVFFVKVEGCDKYAEIAEPFYSSPTYNLGKLFRTCMDWQFKSSEPVKEKSPLDGLASEEKAEYLQELIDNMPSYDEDLD